MIWKTIKGFRNYEVSNAGMIRNKTTMKLLKPYTNNGSFAIKLQKGANGYTRSLGRIVLEAFTTWPPEYVTIHLNGDRTNNSVTNLKRGTMSELFFRARMGKVRGISKWNGKKNKWRAYLSTGDMKCRTIGYYPTKTAAMVAYKNAYRQAYGVVPF